MCIKWGAGQVEQACELDDVAVDEDEKMKKIRAV